MAQWVKAFHLELALTSRRTMSDVGSQPTYEAPGDIQVSETVPSLVAEVGLRKPDVWGKNMMDLFRIFGSAQNLVNVCQFNAGKICY